MFSRFEINGIFKKTKGMILKNTKLKYTSHFL